MTAVLTPAEKAFLTMAKMAGSNVEHWFAHTRLTFVGYAKMSDLDGFLLDRAPWISFNDLGHALDPVVDGPMMVAALYGRFPRDSSHFPIVASTFATLVEERPELREHYDRAKEAWEASQ